MDKMVYLDNHSTTPVDKKVLKKMLPFFSEKFNNPHSHTTKYNNEIIKDIEEARENIASLIGAEKDEIIFTSGATEANNMAIKGLKSKIIRGKNHFISLSTEHKCILEALRKMELEGAKVNILNVKKNGIVDMNLIKESINNETVMVSIMMANNETGVIQPIEEIASFCKKKKILFHTDAAQAVGKIGINVKNMGIDLMSISAHKFYGPKGIGALYIRKYPKIRLTPLIDGGGQEASLRSGTLPVPLCIGFGEAARLAKKNLLTESQRIKKLRNYFIEKISKKVKNLTINGDINKRLPANINFSIPNINAQKLIENLKYTVVSSGSACTSNEIEPSYVLSSMGIKDSLVKSSIRIGIGRFNTKSDIDIAINDICNTIIFLKK